MKIALTTQIYGESYADIGKITEPNHKEYCLKHGYGFHVNKTNMAPYGLSFGKCAYILDLFKNFNYDAIHWSGADTLIMNYNIKIEDFIDDKYDFFISKMTSGWYKNVINADVFVVKNTERGKSVLEFILSKFELYKNIGWAENQVMIDYFNTNLFKNTIKIIPQQSFNSYPWRFYGPDNTNCSYGPDEHPSIIQFCHEPGNFINGDFLLHCPGINNKSRLRIFEYYLPLVKR